MSYLDLNFVIFDLEYFKATIYKLENHNFMAILLH